MFLFISSICFATPYPNLNEVPKDKIYPHHHLSQAYVNQLKTIKNTVGIAILRIQANWDASHDTYSVDKVIIENSGTEALLGRSKNKPAWGSYLGIIKNADDSTAIYFDAIGTGKEYRKLTRAITFRFPLPKEDTVFELYAENPVTGIKEKVASKFISLSSLEKISKDSPPSTFNGLEVKEISLSKKVPALRVNIYADGYLPEEKSSFWEDAIYTVEALKKEKFPGIESMSFYAVFNPSSQKLGSPENLGFPIKEYPTFLGLYYAYWDPADRWYNVVYPTSEYKFRNGLASAPYDYPIVLINNAEYWGVGNYMAFTAIPANHPSFTYLLVHEFGHYFGLNEEYEGGGPTELEFAANIDEPWSQNITFLRDARYRNLKWKEFVDVRTDIPTLPDKWHSHPPVYGAYPGGYGDSPVAGSQSYKPGFDCVMDRYKKFCNICQHGILQVIKYSLGLDTNK